MNKIAKLMIFITVLIITTGTLYYFSPISTKLSILGYSKVESIHTIKVEDNEYKIIVKDNEIDYIEITNLTVISTTYDLLDLVFYKDNKSKVIVTLSNTTSETSCEYNLLTQDFTCLDDTVSSDLIDIVTDQIFLHYIIIDNNVNWGLIPDNQQ